jgi:Tol biopolymer transport system component
MFRLILIIILILPVWLQATEFRQVFSSDMPDGAPTWRPGGVEIAFTSTQSGDWEVWIIDAWGGEPFNFSQVPDTTDIYADWSPDGSSIVFSSMRSNGHGVGDYDLWIQSVEGRDLTCLTTWDGYDNWATFDPSGTKIAFVSDRDGETEIWMMPIDEPTAAVKLSEGPVECHHPCWSPDGAWIAFDALASWDEPNRQLFRVPISGGSTEALPMNMQFSSDPHWSPDGRYLAFAGNDEPVDWDLWLWDFQDEVRIQLTDTRYPEQSPVWNDTGSEIAYAAVISGNKDVWVAYELPLGTSAARSDWSNLRQRFSP